MLLVMLAAAVLFAPALLGFALLASSLEVWVLREPLAARRRAAAAEATGANGGDQLA